MYELDVNDFRHGGTNIIGFSIVDYYNINSIKLLSDVLQTGEPLNKIANIPVIILRVYLKLKINVIPNIDFKSMKQRF